MKKNIVFFLLPIFVLASCGKTPEVLEETTTSKQDFVLETKTISELNNGEKIVKSGKITSASNLTITSQATGKVSKIYVKEGDEVKSGQTLAILDDSILNYGLSLQRAKNALDRANINYDSTVLTLDKSIEDTKLALDKARLNHDILLKDNKIKLEKSGYDLSLGNLGDNTSKSSLDYEKLLKDLDKAKSDYELSLKNDEITLANFKASVKSTYDSLNLVYFDLINLADETFGVSDKNFKTNDLFENYLGAKNPSQADEAEFLIKELLVDYDSFKGLNFDNIDVNDFSKHLILIESRFDRLIKLVDLSKNVLKNSVAAQDFPQTKIDGLFQAFGGYGQSIQSINSGFISLKNNINTFTSTYKDSQKSRLESINILEKQIEIAYIGLQSGEVNLQTAYDRTKLDIENSEKNSLINIQSLENNYNNAVKNKEITLRSLQNAINEANVSYKEASNNYAKLTIKSPISGVISDKFIDVGQEIGSQTRAFNLVGNKQTEVELFLTSDEISHLEVGSEVNIVSNDQTLKGKIDSISNVATSDFTFKTVIKITDKVNIIGTFVDVELPIKLQNLLLPLNTLKILPESKAELKILKDGKIDTLTIEVGKTYSDKIEVLSEIDQTVEIIINDVSNFNPETFNLKINK